MLRLFIFSDLHLEYKRWFECPTLSKASSSNSNKYVNVCILAGDIGWPHEERYYNFLKETKSKFDKVIVISGNHEYYSGKEHRSMRKIDIKINKICQELGCIYLQCSDSPNGTNMKEDDPAIKGTIIIEGYKFIGCTYWSHVPNRFSDLVHDFMNDYKRIYTEDNKLFTIEDNNKLHKKHYEFIEREVKKSKHPVIVITHHSPTFKMLQERYQNDNTSYAFASLTAMNLIDKPIKLWICGHLHNTKTIFHNEVMICNNCRGNYLPNGEPENPDFDKKFNMTLTP